MSALNRSVRPCANTRLAFPPSLAQQQALINRARSERTKALRSLLNAFFKPSPDYRLTVEQHLTQLHLTAAR
ncbi:MAG: hypothetical protein ACPGOV_15525 [Magnetovibrionaceae bacterium]